LWDVEKVWTNVFGISEAAPRSPAAPAGELLQSAEKISDSGDIPVVIATAPSISSAPTMKQCVPGLANRGVDNRTPQEAVVVSRYPRTEISKVAILAGER
jgi:hypothetical protein